MFRRNRWVLPLTVLIVSLAADQTTKAWARSVLPAGRPVPLIDGYWDWELSYNPGAAFSTFGSGGARVLLTIIGIAAVIAIGWMLYRARPEQRLQRWALALVGAGALGNLIDRVGTGFVTDFVRWRWHEHRWPIFNIADVVLVIGAGLLLIESFRGKVRDG